MYTIVCAEISQINAIGFTIIFGAPKHESGWKINKVFKSKLESGIMIKFDRMNMSEAFLKNHTLTGSVKIETEMLTETLSIKLMQNLFCEILPSFEQISFLTFFSFKIIPIDEKTLSHRFIPSTAFGFGKIIAIIAIPSEFKESDFLKKTVPRLQIIIIMPARMTEGVKHVSAMKKIIAQQEIKTEILFPSFSFFKILSKKLLKMQMCIPEVEIRW